MTQAGLNKILKQHQLWLNTDGEEGKKADLRNADLRVADLRYVNLRGLDLEGADLRDADLRVADLKGANLRYSDLTNVNLEGANLRGADLRYVNLRYVNLRGVDLEGTGVYFFKGPGHHGIYNSKDDKLYIGCQVHSLDYWLENYVYIGKKHRYTDEQIETYGNWIKSLKELK